MSEKQKEILEIIKTFISENGYSPTIREICGLSGLSSTSSVHGHIKRLKAKGHITNGFDMPRSIALKERDKTAKFIINVIVFMYQDGKEYILLKENKKQNGNDIIFELPGGVIREGENVYGSLRCKLKANGFKVTKIFGEDKCNELSEEEEVLTVFKPLCVSQSFTDNKLIVSSTILCEVDSAEVKNYSNKSGLRWVSSNNLKAMLLDHKDNIAANDIAALKLFCEG